MIGKLSWIMQVGPKCHHHECPCKKEEEGGFTHREKENVMCLGGQRSE